SRSIASVGAPRARAWVASVKISVVFARALPGAAITARSAARSTPKDRKRQLAQRVRLAEQGPGEVPGRVVEWFGGVLIERSLLGALAPSGATLREGTHRDLALVTEGDRISLAREAQRLEGFE